MHNALSMEENDQLLSMLTKDSASNNLQNLQQRRLKLGIKDISPNRAS